LCCQYLNVAFLPVGGLPPGQEPNSQPSLPTVVGGASDDPVPLLSMAGAEMKESKPALVRLSYCERMLISAQPSSLLCTTLIACAAVAEIDSRYRDNFMIDGLAMFQLMRIIIRCEE
jgi:hypothetical protein